MRSDMKEQIEGFVARYPTRRSAIMPALCLAQECEGSLHGEILKDIADVLDVPEIWVYELTTFYSMFRTEPVGKFHIQLCTNVSCLLCRSGQLLEHFEQRLQIGEGETTPDGLFTLSTVECLGSCDKAPALMVNQDYHENLDETRVCEIIDQLMENSEN